MKQVTVVFADHTAADFQIECEGEIVFQIDPKSGMFIFKCLKDIYRAYNPDYIVSINVEPVE